MRPDNNQRIRGSGPVRVAAPRSGAVTGTRLPALSGDVRCTSRRTARSGMPGKPWASFERLLGVFFAQPDQGAVEIRVEEYEAQNLAVNFWRSASEQSTEDPHVGEPFTPAAVPLLENFMCLRADGADFGRSEEEIVDMAVWSRSTSVSRWRGACFGGCVHETVGFSEFADILGHSVFQQRAQYGTRCIEEIRLCRCGPGWPWAIGVRRGSHDDDSVCPQG